MPPNPNPNSVLSLVVDEKTNHLRMLINKQKSNLKKKKGKSNLNRPYENSCGNNSFGSVMKYAYNSENDSHKKKFNSFNYFGNDYSKSNKFQNTKSNNTRSSSLSPKISQGRCVTMSNSGTSSSLDGNYSIQNGYSSVGYVTDKLRADLERYISENEMVTVYIE